MKYTIELTRAERDALLNAARLRPASDRSGPSLGQQDLADAVRKIEQARPS